MNSMNFVSLKTIQLVLKLVWKWRKHRKWMVWAENDELAGPHGNGRDKSWSKIKEKELAKRPTGQDKGRLAKFWAG